jgi:uncharacterized membrane protein
MPGIGDEIDGAMQQAAQAGRQSMAGMLSRPSWQSMPPARWESDNENHSHWRIRMAKSAAFGVMHLGIAFTIGYLLTGSLAIAGAITLVEPVANTVAHYFFDRWWESRANRQQAGVPS